MNAIRRLNVKRLRSKELLGFSNRVLTIIDEIHPSSSFEPGESFRTAYSAMVDAFVSNDDADDVRRQSSLQQYDAKNDDLWTGLSYQLKAGMLHGNQAVRDAALTVWEVFGEIPNPTELAYEKEIEQLEFLLSRLDTVAPEVHALAHSDEWIDMLRASLAAFREISLARKQSEPKACRMAQARELCILSWYKTVEQINAVAVLDQSPEIEALIDRINALIDRTQTHLNRRSKQKNEDSEDIAFDD